MKNRLISRHAIIHLLLLAEASFQLSNALNSRRFGNRDVAKPGLISNHRFSKNPSMIKRNIPPGLFNYANQLVDSFAKHQNEEEQQTALNEIPISHWKSDLKEANPENLYTAESEILWQHCQSSDIQVKLYDDVSISCEAIVPLGSNVTWYWNGVLMFFHPHKGRQVWLKNEVDVFSVQPNRSNYYEFHLVAMYFIDCFRKETEGIYTLKIDTPSGRSYTRDFKLKRKLGWSHTNFFNSRRCFACKFQNNCYMPPRIVDYAKTVHGKKGQELYLPCRQEYPGGTRIVWDSPSREVEEPDYMVMENGDLRINTLKAEDQGYYTCEVYEGESGNCKYDKIVTYVKVLD